MGLMLCNNNCNADHIFIHNVNIRSYPGVKGLNERVLLFVSGDSNRASFTAIRQQMKSDLSTIAIITLNDCHQSSGLYYKVFHFDITRVFSLAILPES
jgi:hypothetical protein